MQRLILMSAALLLLSPPASTQNPPTSLTYSLDVDSVVTWPLPRLLKAIPKLKGLEPDESQAELPRILQKVGVNVEAFFENFPNTASVEKISMERLAVASGMGALGWPSAGIRESHTQKFRYLALPRPANEGVGLDEYRTDSKGQVVEPGGLGVGHFVTKGFVSVPLGFHPEYQAGSTFRYLGRQVINKRQSHVVAFAQRPGIARIGQRISFGTTSLLVLVQAIAWIDASDYQILRMRTDLLPSKENVGPKRDTTEIEFRTVRFKESTQMLWLPYEVAVSVDWRGNVYQNRHRYSDFRLFTVSTQQKLQAPKEASPDQHLPN